MAELVEKVYAAALFDAAEESGALEEVRSELTILNSIFGENPAFLQLLSSPAVTVGEKHAMLKDTVESKIHGHLFNFLRILSDKGRAALFPRMTTEFEALYRVKRNLLHVEAVTAVTLTTGQLQKLEEKLVGMTGKRILLENKVDPAILGGVILKYNHSEIDGSARERLNGLRTALKNIIA